MKRNWILINIKNIKIIANKAIVYAIKKLTHLQNYIDIKTNQNPYEYEDLAPKDDHDKTIYIDSLAWAIKNQRISNLALTGAYGSGKSTILRTFEKQHPEYNYLNISLATFGDDENIQTINQDSIEKSILQQMFYREKSKKLQHSRFKKIHNSKIWTFFINTALLMLWLFSIVYLLQNESILKLSIIATFKAFMSETLPAFNYLIPIYFLMGLSFLLFNFLKIINKMEISKLDAKGGELTLKQAVSSDVSILNKHLDEILYFFEVTSYNVVVFEDLDRFEKPNIFTKLREINTIVNNSKQIDRHIVFIYAIKDDIFKDDKTRTKFFDFILPVIPIINSSNSESFLKKKFEHEIEISVEFLEDISLYIDDMRTLNNIYNEYIIYSDQIEIKSVKRNKILGMIVYKNIYPEDFANLNQNKGILFDVFNQKNIYIEKIIAENVQTIHSKKEEILKIENEALESIKDVRAVYVYALVEIFSNSESISFSGSRIAINQLCEDEQFEKFRKETRIRNNQSYNEISFADIEKKVKSSQRYEDREQLVISKQTNRVNKIQEEIENLKKINQELQSMPLSKILKEDHSNELFEAKIEDKLILKYLIKHEYIDEMYQLSISHFHEGSLSTNDIDFILQVKDGSPLYFTYPLLKIENVIKKLDGYFDKPEIFNIFLVNHIIENNLTSELDKILGQIISKHPRAIEFLDNFITSSTMMEKLIKTLSNRWSDFWNFIYHDSNYSNEKKEHYCNLIMLNAENNDIVKMDKSSFLSSFIGEKRDYLNWLPSRDETMKKLVESLKIKFVELDKPLHQSILLQTIYETNSYVINIQNIELMIEQLNVNDIDLNDLKISNYTTIKKSSCTKLIKYIDENINEYIKNVLLAIEENTRESESTIIELLSNEEIDLENKQAIIAKTETILKEITHIPDELWIDVFQNSKIQPKWENIFPYFSRNNLLDTVLVNFINKQKNYQVLMLDSLGADEAEKEFEGSLLESDLLSDEAYIALTENVVNRYFDLNISELSSKKIDALLKHNILYLTAQNYSALNELNTRIILIEKNIDFFIENFEKILINTIDAIALLESQVITDEQKSKIIQTFSIDILNNNPKLAKLFYKIWKKYHEDEKLELSILSNLIESLNTELKINLLASQIKFLSKDDITSLLNDIGENYAEITSLKPSRIGQEYYNKNLLEELEKLQYISSFRPKDDYFKINKKRNQ